MKAVILAAGLGTRMANSFPKIPKSMLPIKGKPLIQYQIEHLKSFGIKDIYINLHFLPKKIKHFLGNGSKFGVNITFSLENEILGTSGALNNLKSYLDTTFIVLYGDIYTKLDFNNFLQFHKDKKSQASLLIHKTDHPDDSDLIEINKNGQIVNIYPSPHKKLPNNINFSNAAIYILQPYILQFLPQGFSDFMEDFFPLLLRKGTHLYGYPSSEYTKDMGTPDRYKEIMQDDD